MTYKNKFKFSPHLKQAHDKWRGFLHKEDIAIDATCGNGHDSLILANMLESGELFCFDIQKQAINSTLILLRDNLKTDHKDKIFFINNSHENFSKFISKKVNLIVYNLGYLPKSDKSITTKVDTTLKSLKSAFSILNEKAAISIMCYPGHEEGKKEEAAILNYLKDVDNKKFSICHYKWINKKDAPSFIWIEKKF